MRWVPALLLFVTVSCRGETVGNERTDAGSTPGDVSLGVGCDKTRGPKMVRIDAAGTAYCIDVTEVSVAHFNAFLDAGGPFDAPTFCESQKLSKPVKDETIANQSLPATSMKWCWAHAYCKWAGKRLCGGIAKSGRLDFPFDGQSEWTWACQSGALARKYPYGSSYDDTKCVTAPGTTAKGVGATATCRGEGAPYDQIFDMLGNAAELDGYVGFRDDGQPQTVRSRGWAYGDGDHDGCTSASPYDFASTFPPIGFRCCADP